MKMVDRHSALTSGCDLWLAPDTRHSKWTERLDWYLGFQIRRAIDRVSSRASAKLEQIMRENEIEVENNSVAADAPLLISSSHYLPNTSVVILEFHASLETWLGECQSVWHSLGRPSVRVFLPDSVSDTATNEISAVVAQANWNHPSVEFVLAPEVVHV